MIMGNIQKIIQHARKVISFIVFGSNAFYTMKSFWRAGLRGFVFFLLAGSMFGSAVEHAHAVQFNLNCGQDPCVRASQIWFGAGPASLTYSPGQAIDISARLASDDFPFQQPFSPSLRVAIGNGPFTGNLISAQYSAQDLRDSQEPTLSSGLTAPLTPGPYTMNFALGIAQSRTGWGYGTFPAGARNYSIGFTVVAPTGTINVSASPTGNWTITGPATISGSGASASYTSRPTGMYTMTWNAIAGNFDTPVSTSQTLTNGGTISFPGTYVPYCYYPGGTIVWVPPANNCSELKGVVKRYIGASNMDAVNTASGYYGTRTFACIADGSGGAKWDMTAESCTAIPTVNVFW